MNSSTTQLVRKHRRLVRDIAETAGGGGDDGKLVEESKTGTIPAKSRVGRKTREAVGAVATADGGLELEVSKLLVVHVAPPAEM